MFTTNEIKVCWKRKVISENKKQCHDYNEITHIVALDSIGDRKND